MSNFVNAEMLRYLHAGEYQSRKLKVSHTVLRVEYHRKVYEYWTQDRARMHLSKKGVRITSMHDMVNDLAHEKLLEINLQVHNADKLEPSGKEDENEER